MNISKIHGKNKVANERRGEGRSHPHSLMLLHLEGGVDEAESPGRTTAGPVWDVSATEIWKHIVILRCGLDP